MKLKYERGFVLISSLVFFITFSMLFLNILTLNQLSKSQSIYLKEAKDNALIEKKIINTALELVRFDTDNIDQTIDNNHFIYTQADGEVTVEVLGQFNYVLHLSVNLDNFTIKMYNYNAQ